MAEYLDKSTAVDEGYLFDRYIFSLPEYNDEKLNEPRWTEEHIEELTNDFIVIPKNTPAADVAPVVHGRWIKISLMFASSNGKHGNVHICSNCGEQSGVGFKTPYCAICGAKMEYEEDVISDNGIDS